MAPWLTTCSTIWLGASGTFALCLVVCGVVGVVWVCLVVGVGVRVMMVKGNRSSAAEKKVDSFISFTFGIFLASLHGALRLAILSLPANDPQILGHWGRADEGTLGKCFQATIFGLECWRDAVRLWRIQHIGLVSACLSPSAKSMKISAAPYPETNHRVSFNMATAHLSPFLKSFLLGCSSTRRCA